MKIFEKELSSSFDSLHASTNMHWLCVKELPSFFYFFALLTLFPMFKGSPPESSRSIFDFNTFGRHELNDPLSICEMMSLVEKHDAHSDRSLAPSHSSSSRFHQLSRASMMRARVRGSSLKSKLINISLFDVASNARFISFVPS